MNRLSSSFQGTENEKVLGKEKPFAKKKKKEGGDGLIFLQMNLLLIIEQT